MADNRKTFLKKTGLHTLIVFLLCAVVYSAIAIFIQISHNNTKRLETEITEADLLDVEKTIIANKVDALITDLFYISDSFSLNNIDDGNYSAIVDRWLVFSDSKRIYDQIRFIDTFGNEVIRVNFSEEGSYATQQEDLQNKRDRYYFINTISLQKNQINISKLDLNMENGRIETPIKPMLRFSTPVYGHNGTLEGIVVINYMAEDMLVQVREVALTGRAQLFLLNAQGYWLYNSADRDKEWTFMYSDRENISFAAEFAAEWNQILQHDSGVLETDHGIFNYSVMLPEFDSTIHEDYEIYTDEVQWVLISYIPPASNLSQYYDKNVFVLLQSIGQKNYLVYVLLLGLSILLSVLITKNKMKNDEISYFSEYDVMTGLYNRRAGLERLGRLYRDTVKKSSIMSVCFIDINGLKEVNDHFGHEAGDELILSVVGGIKQNVRQDDIVIRLGGDEFLIGLPGLGQEAAEKIWQRIKREYDEINDMYNRKYVVSASHGMHTFSFDSSGDMDAVINQADEKMYQEKKRIKKDLNIIRQG